MKSTCLLACSPPCLVSTKKFSPWVYWKVFCHFWPIKLHNLSHMVLVTPIFPGIQQGLADTEIGNMIHHYNHQAFIILVLFTVLFYHFLFSRYLDLTKHHFLSDIFVPYPELIILSSVLVNLCKAAHRRYLEQEAVVSCFDS